MNISDEIHELAEQIIDLAIELAKRSIGKEDIIDRIAALIAEKKDEII